MNTTEFLTTIQRLYQRANGSTIQYNLSHYATLTRAITHKADEFRSQPDHVLQQNFQKILFRMRQNSECDDAQAASAPFSAHMLIDVYALVCETARRTIGLQPFDVQIIGGLVLSDGKLADLPTGEGKTLMAVFPACFHALAGQGVHVLTFNDYLARRDADWMGPIYRFLGLRVGVVQEGMELTERQAAYAADVTYLTAKEAGFDFLRDSLRINPGERVQRPFHSAILDEADSILIDEARIPLVLAGSFDKAAPQTYRLADHVRQLDPERDVEFDEYRRNVALTESGLRHIEALLGCDDLYAADQIDLLTRVNCALHAEFLVQRDVDYLVRRNTIELIDEFTGRIADKRRWPDGLQAALEAKEHLPSQTGGVILNSITFQHFLRCYPKLGGMTATAQSAADEFQQFYKLDVVVIPPHLLCQRQDFPDRMFTTLDDKYAAVLDEIISVNRTGRPILVGTRSVEESARLAQALQTRGVTCQVLNAKHDAQEAAIIAQAGQLGAVTISTNMAGRGTDIRLGGADESRKTEVATLGGLYVIGLNRHDSPRIDLQLRGRAGRQGDPGSSRFFISLEDDLFVKYRLADLLPRDASEAEKVREIDRIQRIIEGQNLEIKKTLNRYASLIEEQRQILAEYREGWLEPSGAAEFFASTAPDEFEACCRLIGQTQTGLVCRRILLYALDSQWMRYLAEVADVRESLHLHRIGGQNPFLEFQKFVVARFDALLDEIEDQALQLFARMRTAPDAIEAFEQTPKTPSATWTYLVNDDPFEHRLIAQTFHNFGLAAGAAFMWPLMALVLLVRRWLEKRGLPRKPLE